MGEWVYSMCRAVGWILNCWKQVGFMLIQGSPEYCIQLRWAVLLLVLILWLIPVHSQWQIAAFSTHASKQKHLHVHRLQLSVLSCIVDSLSCCWVICTAGAHTPMGTRAYTQVTNSNKAQSSFLDCLTFGLCPGGCFCTSFPPQQRGMSLGLFSPAGSLPGACLLSVCLLCLKLSLDCPGCSLCWVTHTHTPHTHASLVVQWNRTGGWAGDTSPESQWCPSFSCNLLFSTYIGIQTATFIHTRWSMLTGWPLLATPCVSLSSLFLLERQRFSADDCNLTVFSLISPDWWLALSQIQLLVCQSDIYTSATGWITSYGHLNNSTDINVTNCDDVEMMMLKSSSWLWMTQCVRMIK